MNVPNVTTIHLKGFPCGSAGKEPPSMQETWVGKIPWRRERLPIPVFWPRKFHGLYSPWGSKELDTTEQLSLSHRTKGNHVKRIKRKYNEYQ